MELKEIFYKNIDEMEICLKQSKFKHKIPSDDYSRLCKGYMVSCDDENLEYSHNWEHHLAPLHDECTKECSKIVYTDAGKWNKVKEESINNGGIVYSWHSKTESQSGFVLYPQREWHLIPYSCLFAAQAEKINEYVKKTRI